MTVLESARKWIKTCPLIDKANRFNISYLGAGSAEYTLTEASDTHRQDVCGFDLATYNLVFMANFPYGAVMAENIGAAEFFTGLSAWIRDQDRAKNYPQVDGYEVTRVAAANAGVIIQAGADIALYQLQIKMDLEEE